MSIMNPSGLAPSVRPVRGFEMRVAKEPWPFAEENRDAVEGQKLEQQDDEIRESQGDQS